jgi:hypothetical protein
MRPNFHMYPHGEEPSAFLPAVQVAERKYSIDHIHLIDFGI